MNEQEMNESTNELNSSVRKKVSWKFDCFVNVHPFSLSFIKWTSVIVFFYFNSAQKSKKWSKTVSSKFEVYKFLWGLKMRNFSTKNSKWRCNFISSLLSIGKLVVRIGIIYEHNASAKMIFASGFLITDRLVLTCAHNFDVIQWANQKVRYSKTKSTI